MTGFWIALSIRLTAAEILQVLEHWFPALVIADWDLSSIERARETLEDLKPDHADVLIQVHYNQSELPTGIEFDRFPGPQDEGVIQPTILALARMFAEALNCRTVCEGSAYGDDDSPFWVIIWDEGRSYLGDDCESEFGYQTGEPVKIVREITLESFTLDGSGNLIR